MKRRDFIKTTTAVGLSLALSGCSESLIGKQTPRSRKPNILLLFSDQHNADFMGCAGYPNLITPNLDKLARDGVRFTRTYCQDGICVPSRSSMMTGQYPRTTGVLENSDRAYNVEQLHPLYHLLKENGYITGCFGKQHLPGGMKRGFDHSATTIGARSDPSDEYYSDWIKERGQAKEAYRDGKGSKKSPLMCHISDLKPENTQEAYIAKKSMEFLKKAKESGKPFFCWTSFFHPHQPYTPVKKWADLYPPSEVKLPDNLREPVENLPPHLQGWRKNSNRPWALAEAAADENIYRNYISYYCALVTEVDHYVGEVIASLKEQGMYEDTIIIYTADHGDFVARHGMVEKCALGHNVYEDTLKVPMIMSWADNFEKGHVNNDLTELVDIYPTLLDLCDIEKPANVQLPGKSLAKVLEKAQGIEREFAVSENWSQVTIITERYKFGHWIEPPYSRFDFREFGDMIFDLEKDPTEVNNLIDTPKGKKIKAKLLKHYETWVKETPAKGKEISSETALVHFGK